MTNTNLLRALIALLCLLLTTACTMTKPPIGNPEAPYPPAGKPQIGDIIHLPTGHKVSHQAMLNAATDARIVYVGETHDNMAAHRLQLQLLQAMQQRYPGEVSLGMEMFTREQQPTLDLWVAGELSEKEFLKKSNWYGVWTQDFAYYRDILNYARSEKIPVVGLNVTKEQRRKVAMTAPKDLTPEERDALPEMDLNDPYQKAMTKAIYSGHTMGGRMLESFIRIQTLWDEAMAQAVAQELEKRGPQHRMLVMAGGNHIRYGFGIPRRVYRRLPSSYVLVGNYEVELTQKQEQELGIKQQERRTMDVEMPRFPMPPYDYQIISAYEKLDIDQVKIGIYMKKSDDGVTVEKIVPDSAAAKAGLQPGDVLVALRDERINDNFDLIYALKQYKFGDETALTVERDGESLTLLVTFTPVTETPKMQHKK